MSEHDATLLAVSDRWWNVWRDGDIDAMNEIFTDPLVRHSANGSETFTLADYRKRIAEAVRTISRATTRIDDRVVSGDRVWTRATSRGLNLETGEQTSVSWIVIQRFEGDRIAEQWLTTTPVEWKH